ncbi:hypothetical protein PVAND_006600 [Polypedilum vanderplanki]|uniref:La-related protein 7 n=1 Tax=Polypedilum vanderplanki TaxID=319348 RepID=A0A9J6C4M0_POLVA|nr:hypothetical protein PVAND_006600 [Polypedilum vanderplanki]
MEKEYLDKKADDQEKVKEEERETNNFRPSRNKKQMYIKLKNQMEFYFSPSNIARDKFVGKMLQEDPKIPIRIFLTFNKIKDILNSYLITEDKQLQEIVKSLSSSEILQVTDDNTKVSLKKEIPKKTQQEIDELTIYVEHIPLSSTHDSIKNIFSKYGKINYISLPRYKKSGQIKQFCFIEFDDQASVQNVLQTFKKLDGLLLHQNTKPENLLSIITFDSEKETNKSEVTTNNLHESEDEGNHSPPTKKLKLALEVKNEEVKEENQKNTSMEDEKSIEDNVDDEVNTEVVRKKKLRKHKRNHSKKNSIDERMMVMKVMKKTEWKKLRNAYLTLERQKAKEIKKILRESYNKRTESKNQPLQTSKAASPKISFYGSPDHFNDQTESFESHQTLNNFTPGCIVNIKFREPCVDCKEFKKELKQFSFVQYVDIPEGATQCFIRVDNSQSAHEIVNHYSSCEYETEILKDENEKNYWKKIFENREKKRRNKDSEKNKMDKSKRRRGREKLVIKIAKATKSNQIIRFNEFDE